MRTWICPPRFNCLSVRGATGPPVLLVNEASLTDPDHPDYLGRREALGVRRPRLKTRAEVEKFARRAYRLLCQARRFSR